MPAGVYLHIPFCKTRCSYCDFATDVYRSSDAVERYVSALRSEIEKYRTPDPKSQVQDPKLVDTIYFGGGTPSLLSPRQVTHIVDSVRERFEIEPEPEITMEMNPATVTPETLSGYRSSG